MNIYNYLYISHTTLYSIDVIHLMIFNDISYFMALIYMAYDICFMICLWYFNDISYFLWHFIWFIYIYILYIYISIIELSIKKFCPARYPIGTSAMPCLRRCWPWKEIVARSWRTSCCSPSDAAWQRWDSEVTGAPANLWGISPRKMGISPEKTGKP